MPGDNVEWSVILTSGEKGVVEFAVQAVLGWFLLIIERSHRGLEVTRVGEAVRANGTKFWELIVTLVELTDVPSYWASW